jgi:hypothetical protein
LILERFFGLQSGFEVPSFDYFLRLKCLNLCLIDLVILL